MNDARPYLFDLDPPGLAALVAEWGLPAYRATQVLEWVYRKHVAEPEKMLNISKMDRQLLADKLRFAAGRVVEHQRASDGVQKLLIDWPPEGFSENASPGLLPVLGSSATQSECVVIPAGGTAQRSADADWDDGDDEPQPAARRTACVSSQIGCPVGCKFCASGLAGLDGNLSAGQIVEQVWRLGTLPGVGDILRAGAKPITHVVFMGMGEPLANFDAVAGAIRRLTAAWGLGISARRITVSTVGLPAQIRRLAAMDIPVTLAISLHAPNDPLRRKLIPWAQYVNIQQLLDAAREYFDHTGRQVTLEYILLRKVNDRPEHARELAGLARELGCNVNLIRYNEVKGLPFDRPTTADVHQFQAILRRAGVSAHIRASRGRDIAAACGQLRHEHAGV